MKGAEDEKVLRIIAFMKQHTKKGALPRSQAKNLFLGISVRF